VGIQIEKLIEKNTESVKRAFLILKVIFEKEVIHRSSVIRKNLVNKISR